MHSTCRSRSGSGDKFWQLTPPQAEMRRKMSKNSGKNRFLCHWSYHLLKSLDLGGYTNDSRARHPARSWHYKMLQRL